MPISWYFATSSGFLRCRVDCLDLDLFNIPFPLFPNACIRCIALAMQHVSHFRGQLSGSNRVPEKIYIYFVCLFQRKTCLEMFHRDLAGISAWEPLMSAELQRWYGN